jgi:hypothetical protein
MTETTVFPKKSISRRKGINEMIPASRSSIPCIRLTVLYRHICLSQQRLESGYDLVELWLETTVGACRENRDEHIVPD